MKRLKRWCKSVLAVCMVTTCSLNSIVNTSRFIFYHNGHLLDKGIGRQLILGSEVGADAGDGGSVIDKSSHLDIFQESFAAPSDRQTLILQTAPNTGMIINGIQTGNIANQFSVHTIYLGHRSNISIGSNVDTANSPFVLNTMPTLDIDGNFFALETRGGRLGLPETSGITGEGGIFVDNDGTIKISNRRRMHIAAMVTRSRNGIIDLPKKQVHFDNRVGIQSWQPDMTDAGEQILIKESECFSNFTMDWNALQKDFISTFTPYEIETSDSCSCPTVVTANITSLPTVKGEVDQFQIKGSLIGAQAHLMVDGGFIRELVFLDDPKAGMGALGIVVLKNDARVGLGNADRNLDSNSAPGVLGTNGIVLIADGNGVIELNDNLVVDNFCHILKGPNFGLGGVTHRLMFRAPQAFELRIKSNAILDLSDFTASNEIIEFAGRVRLILEPGARLIMGGGILKMTGQTAMMFEQVQQAGRPAGTTLSSSDDIRVKFNGRGIIRFEEDASCFVPCNAYVGIETYPECNNNTTDMIWVFTEQSSFKIGDDSVFGGVFQIGNPTSQAGHTVDFTLIFNGINAEFELNSQGFLGLGVGIVDKPIGAPDAWLVDTLFNVSSITIACTQGFFRHQQIFAGSSTFASLMAIGPNGTFAYTRDILNFFFLGGGNMILVPVAPAVPFNPVVGTTPGSVGSYSVELMSSGKLLDDITKQGLAPFVGTTQTLAATTPSGFLSFLRVLDHDSQASPRTTLSRNQSLSNITIGFVESRSTGVPLIRRNTADHLTTDATDSDDLDRVLRDGAAGIGLSVNGGVSTLTEN